MPILSPIFLLSINFHTLIWTCELFWKIPDRISDVYAMSMLSLCHVYVISMSFLYYLYITSMSMSVSCLCLCHVRVMSVSCLCHVYAAILFIQHVIESLPAGPSLCPLLHTFTLSTVYVKIIAIELRRCDFRKTHFSHLFFRRLAARCRSCKIKICTHCIYFSTGFLNLFVSHLFLLMQ